MPIGSVSLSPFLVFALLLLAMLAAFENLSGLDRIFEILLNKKQLAESLALSQRGEGQNIFCRSSVAPSQPTLGVG